MKYLPVNYNEESPLYNLYLKLIVKDLVDIIFSHNEIIELCVPRKDEHIEYSQLIWKGHAHELPKDLGEYKFIRIFGAVAEDLYKSDHILILCENPENFNCKLVDFELESSYNNIDKINNKGAYNANRENY